MGRGLDKLALPTAADILNSGSRDPEPDDASLVLKEPMPVSYNPP